MPLTTQTIPSYGGEPPGDWQTFLVKAAKGSIKAVETLQDASLAYMVALTGDPTAPETWNLSDYRALFERRFPQMPRPASLPALYDQALASHWIATPFRCSETPRNPRERYRNLWGRDAVNVTELLNDALLLCLEGWCAERMMACVDHYETDYDARLVVGGMLFLSLTWPDT